MLVKLTKIFDTYMLILGIVQIHIRIFTVLNLCLHMFKRLYFLICCFLLYSAAAKPLLGQTTVPTWVDLQSFIPAVKIDMRYYGSYNFLGRPVNGYHAPKALLTKPAAEALKKVALALQKEGLGIKIFDAYRPQQAVDDFVAWAMNPTDTLTKHIFYPEIPKNKLFDLGYIAKKSGHSRGSTVDLTLYVIKTGEALDMGGSFDYFGKSSAHSFKGISKQQQQNRRKLRQIMKKYNFKAYAEEWWHYTLIQEPYPSSYFNFPIH